MTDLESNYFRLLDPWSRLIIIGGMARTGTSALASFIGSHPDVVLTVGKRFSYLAECDLLRLECGPPDCKAIDLLLAAHPDKRILIKQPWISLDLSFLCAVMQRGGKVIICFRQRESLLESWRGTNFVSQFTKENATLVYEDRLSYDLMAVEMGAIRVDIEDMGIGLVDRLAQTCRLSEDGFDSKNLQERFQGLSEDWLSKHAVWQERVLWMCGKEKLGG